MINLLSLLYKKAAALLLLVALFISAAHLLRAQTRGSGTEAMWRDVDERSLDQSGGRILVPERYRTVQLDRTLLSQTLATAPAESSRPAAQNPIIHLPMPDGTMARFRFEHSPIVEAGLISKYPALQHTYRAKGVDDPTATARFDWMPSGFHAMILAPSGTVLIDPYAQGNTEDYITYFKRDAANLREGFECHVMDMESDIPDAARTEAPAVTAGTQLRTYRLALASTNEYTVAVGSNTVAGALAAKVVVMNRVNGVYERDVAIRMIMIANNNLITFAGDNNTCGTLQNEPCTSANDPYTNNSGSTMLGQNTTAVNARIGTANYDIGHVFSTGGGGVATLNGPCGTSKARGVTGLPNPIGDPFSIDYVAHELGHQWGGNHTFNGCGTGQRSASSAMEPGSGITIMAYAGLCGGQNLANFSIDTFHVRSIEEIVAYSQTGNGNTCASTTATGNSVPVVTGPGNFTVPKQTPFVLTATATDADEDDVLTYDWQEYDLGPNATTIPNTDADGNARPIFRVYYPTTSGTRYFPSLPYILNNANVPPTNTGSFMTGELLPAISRVMNFQVIVRDNRSGTGAVNTVTSTVTIDGTAQPFAVTAPNTGISVPALTNLNVTWVPSGPAANVLIALSTDGGLTFPHVLAQSVPNNGSANVTLPNVSTSMARVKVQAVGNIYFDISDTNFTVTPSAIFAVSSAVSRKMHGALGPFDIPLPLSEGLPGVESRIVGEGGHHTIVVSFNRQIVSGSASVTGGTATIVAPPEISGSTMTIELSNVADEQIVSLTLEDVTDGSAQVLPDTVVDVGFLLGDTNNSGAVSAADVGQTKSFSGLAANAQNFRADVNLSGAVNATDLSIVKSRSGAELPASGTKTR